MSVVSVTAGPRRGWKSVSTWIGAVIVGIAMICAVFAPLLVPHDPFTQDLSKRLLPPFWMAGTNPDYILGTDQLGRDYLSRLIWGCRISMMIGVACSRGEVSTRTTPSIGAVAASRSSRCAAISSSAGNDIFSPPESGLKQGQARRETVRTAGFRRPSTRC